MKNTFVYLSLVLLLLTGCKDEKSSNMLTFATSPEYPPFEYMDKGDVVGFDIDLAKLIAKTLGKQAEFKPMQFSTILPALQNGEVDAAISTLSITQARKQNFDFTTPYYTEGMATVFKTEQPIGTESQLSGKKIACQLGSIMEIWLKQHVPSAHIMAMDSNNQSIEALKAGHVDAVLMDGMQAQVYSTKNTGLSYAVIATADEGYGLAIKKGSPLTRHINHALKQLEAEGEIKKLHDQWLVTNK
jgi:polar amino acid transport system substrate-binding protein